MPLTHLMSEICNLAYLIVENIVEEQYDRSRGKTGEFRRRKKMQRPHQSRDPLKKATPPPKPFRR
jgi:hypothetical protein